MLDVQNIKKDFPILGDPSVVYLDNAATSQKPLAVIEAVSNYYRERNANPHRSAHRLGQAATDAFEDSREVLRAFINAKSVNEVVFTKSATESLNLLSTVFSRDLLSAGDEVLITVQEHHANLVNWMEACKMNNANLVYAFLKDDYTLDTEEFLSKINEKTKIVSFTQASNVTGAITDVKELVAEIRKRTDAIVIVDGCQGLPHIKVDVRDLDCDFFVASGHKLLAPMGIGLLYGKEEKLNALKPFHYGGDMIEYVFLQEATYQDSPFRFEAGTQNVGGAVGFAEAVKYLEHIGMDKVHAHEKELMDYAFSKFSAMEDVLLYTTSSKERTGVLSFNIDGAHPHDIATILDADGVMIRSGHHCAQPLHRYLKKPFSARASFYIYNDKEDVDKLVASVQKVREVLGLGSK